MQKRALAFVAAAGLLAALAASSAAAGNPSCVGEFASTNAQQSGAAFGAHISFGGQTDIYVATRQKSYD
ncbi:MAG: hypothetical protein K0S82_298 [Gaiellaceae bacterium]|jgi:hypothetical protein|nr:hypothetical protein [Gaiellaceae bacterium]